MNKVIISGRLTRDAEVRYSQGERPTAIARATVAVERRFRRESDEQTADFIGIIAFSKVAEFLEKYGRKGIKFNIVGRIQTGSFTNKDGVKVYTTDVVVEEIEFAESKSSGQAASATGQDSAATAPSGTLPTDSEGFVNIPDNIDEELPFN